ncbi:TPA: HD-GYP domain-containing protein [bacterium]|nr:HD-GYP domain-containing protein [bacterium]
MFSVEKFIHENLAKRFPSLKKYGKILYLREFMRKNFIGERILVSRRGVKELIEGVPEVISLKTKKAAMEVVAKAIDDIRIGKVLELNPVKKVVKDMVEEALTNYQWAMLSLIKIRSFDKYTFTHSVNVALLSIIIGIELKFNRDELNRLALGAILHDLGKINIDHSILIKPGPLNEEEFAQIRKHPLDGYQMLPFDSGGAKMARTIAKQHHERENGTGYPEGLIGNQIDEFAAIVAVADVYDALTTDRPYRNRLLPYEAMKTIIAMSGSGFRKKIAGALLSAMAIYPQGSFVRLNTGEIAMIIRPNRRAILRPAIRLLVDAEGRSFRESVDVDLLTQPNRYITGYVDEEVFQRAVV